MSAAELIEQVRARGQASVETAVSLLDLYALSDTEQKWKLVDMAMRGLPAREVVGKFVQTAAAETDDELRAELISVLYWIDLREVPDLAAWVKLLTSSLDHERERGRAAACLGRMVAQSTEAIDALVAGCRATTVRSQQRSLVAALCTLEVPPPPVRALFLELLDKVDADAKEALVARLVLGDGLPAAVLARLLGATEPTPIKLLAIDHAIDRGLDLDAALATLLGKDPEATCRRAAASALAARGGSSEPVVNALLSALQKDPDTSVRAAAALAFEHSLATSEPALQALAAALATERTRDGLLLLLRMVSPLSAKSPAIRAALLKLLREGLRADVAALVYETLGKLSALDAELSAQLLAALQTEQDQRVRGALLEAILQKPDPLGELLPVYLAALQSSEARLRTLGAKGLLRVPLVPAQAGQLGPAVELLADSGVDRWTRATLAQKLARLAGADGQRALGPVLKKIAPQIADEGVRKICGEAADRAAAAAAASAGPEGPTIDWNEWFHRVEVEHRTDGIFPDLFVHFDDNPDAARRILRAALNPPASETLYPTYKGQLREETIVAWLRDRGLVDDDVSRFALTRLLDKSRYEGDAFYLGLLRSNPNFPTLREDVWRLIEVRRDPPPVLLRELIVAAYQGSDDDAAAELKKRIAAVKTPEQAAPFLKFLAGNAPWPPAQEAFALLPVDAPAYAEEKNHEVIVEIAKAMNRKLPEKPAAEEAAPTNQGPGLADD